MLQTGDCDSHLIQVNFKFYFPPIVWQWTMTGQRQCLCPSIQMVRIQYGIQLLGVLEVGSLIWTEIGWTSVSLTQQYPWEPPILAWALATSLSLFKDNLQCGNYAADAPLLAIIAISQPCLHFLGQRQCCGGWPAKLRLISNVIDMKLIESH